MANGNDNSSENANANDNDGVTKPKPFYKSIWFIILMALLALVLIFALAVFAYNEKMKSNCSALSDK